MSLLTLFAANRGFPKVFAKAVGSKALWHCPNKPEETDVLTDACRNGFLQYSNKVVTERKFNDFKNRLDAKDHPSFACHQF